MTIGDLAHLGSPNGAQRTQAPQIARGRVVRAPASVTDSMVVALDRYALAFPYEVLSGRWPAGGRLPQSGDVCLVIFDDAGDAWVRGGAWQAETLLAVDGSGVSSALQLLTALNLHIDLGKTTYVAAAAGWQTATVNFNTTFSAAPVFLFSVEVPTGSTLTASESRSVSTTNALVDVNPTVAETLTIHWIAIG